MLVNFFFVDTALAAHPLWRLVSIASVRIADFLALNCGCDISKAFSHMNFQLFAESLSFPESGAAFLFRVNRFGETF